MVMENKRASTFCRVAGSYTEKRKFNRTHIVLINIVIRLGWELDERRVIFSRSWSWQEHSYEQRTADSQPPFLFHYFKLSPPLAFLWHFQLKELRLYRSVTEIEKMGSRKLCIIKERHFYRCSGICRPPEVSFILVSYSVINNMYVYITLL